METSNRTLPDFVVLAHSITAVPARAPDAVVVCGSHGGRYSAACALASGLSAVVFNDAGIGLDHAGIAGLLLLEEHGVPGLAVSHLSARIGDASDSWDRGRIAAMNAVAARCGVRSGMPVPEACARLPREPRQPLTGLDEKETRQVVQLAGVPVRVLDSNSLVDRDDAGAIVVTGSHGGLLGGDPGTAVRQDVFAAFYNDAGVGIDRAGTSRLPALDRRGIAGITVDAGSARIGDGMSTWRDGVVSFVNERAAALGVAPRSSVQAAVARLAEEWVRRSRRNEG